MGGSCHGSGFSLLVSAYYSIFMFSFVFLFCFDVSALVQSGLGQSG